MKRTFTRSLFLSVAAIFILLAVCFSVYLYQREKEYKIDIMQLRLQAYGDDMVHALGREMILNPDTFHDYIADHYIEDVRVTVISTNGDVLLDSRSLDTDTMENHLGRKEVNEALKNGHGYAIKRTSETLNEDFFYSAAYYNEEGFIVRVAVPYDSQLANSLEADHGYLFFAIFITVMLGIVLYRNTSRIGKHISYLRRFALKAEHGEPLDTELQAKVPNDELSDISHTIMKLYLQLKNSEEDKVRMKRQLTQNAAHELKTPAATIQGFLETIINNPDMTEEKRKDFLERCYKQSVRMSNLLTDMAALTKLDETANVTDKQPVDMKALVNSVLDDTAVQIEENNITAVTDIPDNITIPGDPKLLYSIFRNLIDNIMAYAIGADRITITCRPFKSEDGENDGSAYEFVVADNGCGVDTKHLPLLFERFYRVDKGRSRKLGGTGLGLAIVKNAVTLHGGTIVAEQTAGGGLTIRFTLKI